VERENPRHPFKGRESSSAHPSRVEGVRRHRFGGEHEEDFSSHREVRGGFLIAGRSEREATLSTGEHQEGPGSRQ
jgi:hypothetical protein